jgi:Uma2 family endonuclease
VDSGGLCPVDRLHVNATNLLLRYLNAAFGDHYVQSQDPIGVAPSENATNAPEPDAAVTRLPVDEYTEDDPGPEDLRLVVEVSDATESRDRLAKAALYARSGITEYWIVLLRQRLVRVHRLPDPETARYTSVVDHDSSQEIAPLAAPDRPVRVADLLPKEK